MDLKDKVIVVTGGARDIGREISVKLARSGAKVAINYFHNPDDAAETLKLVEDEGGDAIIVKGDMTSGGSIVNFASQAARDGGGPGASVYAASKAAVMTFTRGMAKELGPQNIRVNSLCPGLISTSFHDRFSKDQVRPPL